MSTTAGKFKGAAFFLISWSGVEAAYPASILQHWSWKHPACELRHLIVDNNPKFLQVWVRSTHHAIALHQSTDFFLSVRSRSRCGFDHCGCLIVCELLYTSLSCHYITDLKRQVCMLLLLSHLKAWKMGVFQLQTILLLKILSYCTFHSLTIF